MHNLPIIQMYIQQYVNLSSSVRVRVCKTKLTAWWVPPFRPLHPVPIPCWPAGLIKTCFEPRFRVDIYGIDRSICISIWLSESSLRQYSDSFIKKLRNSQKKRERGGGGENKHLSRQRLVRVHPIFSERHRHRYRHRRRQRRRGGERRERQRCRRLQLCP